MKQPIRAIDTEWNGYLFRSRLEARYAVFFDALKIPYEYEPEGFEMDGVRYLPDFWLPDHQCWFEVKPEQPTEAEQIKAARLAEHSDYPVYVSFGQPWPLNLTPGEATGSAWKYTRESFNVCYVWTECTRCGFIGLASEGHPLHLPCGGCNRVFKLGTYELLRTDRTPRLMRAWRAARQARFEFYPKHMRGILEDSGLVR